MVATHNPVPHWAASALVAVVACVLWATMTWALDANEMATRLVAQRGSPAGSGKVLTQEQQKVDSVLRPYVWPGSSLRSRAVTPPAGTASVPWRKDGRLRVIVKVSGVPSESLPLLIRAGFDVEIANDQFAMVQGWIAEGAVPVLAGLSVVRSITPAWPGERRSGQVTSQGDLAARSNLVRQLGFTGSGVTVGVISDGIDRLVVSQQTGDLPAVLVPPDARCGRGSGDEGTAMLEIVHDLAPGATLLFSEGLSSALQLISSIQCLAAAGSGVIVDDIGINTEPVFEDGPVAIAAAQAVAAGASYHSAAGNDQGKYVVEDYRVGPVGLHDFDSGVGQAILNLVVLPPGGSSSCFLQWADPFGASANDYDLLGVEPVSGTIIAESANPQTGSQDPTEAVILVNPFASSLVLGLAIARYSGVSRPLRLLCPRLDLEFSSQRFGIFGHPARPEVISVAAISALDPGLNDIESFSSRGPTPIFFPVSFVRPKPDLAAFDGVSTTAPGFNPFVGTSAAAPHSAAVAALLLSKNPSLSPAQLQDVLKFTAVDIAPTGVDDAAGFGRIDALAAINAVPAPLTTTSTSTTIPTGTATTSTTTPAPRCTVDGCDDGNACTDDMCDPLTGCQHAPSGAPCSDGTECTLADRCSSGQCQPGASVTAGTLSTLITTGVNTSLADCRSDKRKKVRTVVNPLVQAVKAFSRAEVAGVGSKKWAKEVAKGEKAIGNARSKLTRVQASLSSACAEQLGEAIRTGALGDACLR